MSDDVWGQPPIPPPKKDRGEILTRFHAWVESNGSTPKGYHRFSLGVPNAEVYKMMRMAEKKGVLLYFEVYAPPKVEDIDLESLLDDDERELREALGMGDDDGWS